MAQGNFRKLGAKSVPNLLDKINRVEIVDNVVDGGSGVPLSAEQGKSLKIAIATESSDRISGDNAIRGTATSAYNDLGKVQGVIEANKASADQGISDLRDEITNNIGVAVANLQAEDVVINGRIDTEVSDRQTAISNEASTRETADNNLDAKVVQEIADRTSAVSNIDTAYKAADVILQNNINSLQTASELAVSTEVAARTAADNTLDGKINTEKTERIADIAAVTASVATEVTNRTSADNALDLRLSAVETGYATGAKFKGAVANLAAFDTMSEASMESGWTYIVDNGSTGSTDVYVVVSDQSGEYVPASWTIKSVKWLMDASDVTNAVSTERTQRVAGDAQVQNNVDTLAGVVSSNKQVLEASIATLRTDMENADSAEATARTNGDAALQSGLDAEISNRETAVAAVNTNLAAETTAREAAITAEASTRQTADEAVQANVDAEVTARQTAVSAEATARQSADTALDGKIDTEVAARIAAVSAEASTRQSADEALDARLDILEGANTVEGSVAKALLDAKKYADLYIPMPVIEGHDGTLLVVGDTVTLSNNVWRGLNGVLLGEVIVYQANGDAVMVSVGNVSGNVITLNVDTAGEHNGCEVKVHYLIIEADQQGAGMGAAGSGGAGI